MKNALHALPQILRKSFPLALQELRLVTHVLERDAGPSRCGSGAAQGVAQDEGRGSIHLEAG